MSLLWKSYFRNNEVDDLHDVHLSRVDSRKKDPTESICLNEVDLYTGKRYIRRKLWLVVPLNSERQPESSLVVT